MEIDFLKNKTGKENNKETPKHYPVDYTDPNLVKAKKISIPKAPKAKKQKIIPAKPPIMEKKSIIPEIPKLSWWQKIKGKFKRQPKLQAYLKPSLPEQTIIKKPVSPPSPPPLKIKKSPPNIFNAEEYQLIRDPKDQQVFKEQYTSKEVIITPPPILHREALKSLTPEVIKKIEKGENVASFLDVNLIPEKLVAGLNPMGKIRSIVWVCIAAMVFILLISSGMLMYQSRLINQVQQTQGQIKATEDEIIAYAGWQQNVVDFNTRVQSIVTILDRHVYWTAFLTALEENTLPNVFYTSLNGDISGIFTLAATAPDYETVSKQIAVFKQADFVSNVVVVGAESALLEINAVGEENGNTNAPITETKEVKFNISLTVKPDVFYRRY